jgi:hypothetical protein
MFYCEPCRVRMGWPQSVMRWRSVCELCNTYSDDCNDIPSRALPDPSYDSRDDINCIGTKL